MIVNRTKEPRTERRNPAALLAWATRKRDEVLQQYRQLIDEPYRSNRRWRVKNQEVLPHVSRELAKWDRLVNRYRTQVDAEAFST